MAKFIIVVIFACFFSPSSPHTANFIKIIPVISYLKSLIHRTIAISGIIICPIRVGIPTKICCAATLEFIVFSINIKLCICHQAAFFIVVIPLSPFLTELRLKASSAFRQVVPLIINLHSLTCLQMPRFIIVVITVLFFSPSGKHISVFVKIIPVVSDLKALILRTVSVSDIIIHPREGCVPAKICCTAALEFIILSINNHLCRCYQAPFVIIIKPFSAFLAEPVSPGNSIFIKIIPLFSYLEALCFDLDAILIIVHAISFFYPPICYNAFSDIIHCQSRICFCPGFSSIKFFCRSRYNAFRHTGRA